MSPPRIKNASTFATVESAALLYTSRPLGPLYGRRPPRPRHHGRESLRDPRLPQRFERRFFPGPRLRRRPSRDPAHRASAHAHRNQRACRVLLDRSEDDPLGRPAYGRRQHRGTTKGKMLTYWANDDKLLVNGAKKSRSVRGSRSATPRPRMRDSKPTKSARPITAAAWWTTFRSRSGRARWLDCSAPTAPARLPRST